MTSPTYMTLPTKQAMNRVTAQSMPFKWSINPYRGCTHGCSFCYARDTHVFLGMSADDTFQTHIFVKDSAPEALELQLQTMLRKHGGSKRKLREELQLVAIGTATDPYQPIEARRQITRQCLKILMHYEVPTSITTRSPLILRDLDVLTKMDIRSINISIGTMNREFWRNLEPASPSPDKRLEAVQRLVEHDLYAGVFLAPIVPYLTDSRVGLDEVLLAVSQTGARFVTPSVLRLSSEVKNWFFAAIAERYPALLPKLRRLYPGVYPSRRYTDPLFAEIHRLMTKYDLASYDASAERHRVEEPHLEERTSIQLTLSLS